MAPEQFADAKTAGVQCNVYSLGATLYGALTGRLAFDAKAAMAILAKKEKAAPVARAVMPGISERVTSRSARPCNRRRRIARRPAWSFSSCSRPGLDRRRQRFAQVRRGVASSPGSNDRRAFFRRPPGFRDCTSVDRCRRSSRETEELWPLIVRDISVTGSRRHAGAPFEPGTELTVEISLGEAGPRMLPTRVVRVVAETGGHWVHGCSFTRPLSEDELSALVQLAYPRRSHGATVTRCRRHRAGR